MNKSFHYVRVVLRNDRADWGHRFVQADTRDAAIALGRRSFDRGRVTLPPDTYDDAIPVTRGGK